MTDPGSLIVVAVLPGFDHTLAHGVHEAAGRVRDLVGLLARGALAGGSLTDGGWAWFGPGPEAWEVALSAASAGAGVGLDGGPVLEMAGGPPVGLAAWAATSLARRARPGEVLVPADPGGQRAAPRGVGTFRAPDALWLPGRPVDVVRDYR